MNLFNKLDLIILSPIIWITIMICITCLIAGFWSTSILSISSLTGQSTTGEMPSWKNASFINLSKILIHLTFIIGLVLLYIVNNETKGTVIYGNGLLQTNSYIMMIQSIVWLTAYIVMIYYLDEINKRKNTWLQQNNYDYITIIFTNIIGLYIVVGSNDLITLYIGIELQTLGAFILVAIRKISEFSIEGALKYFVLGALSSAILLFGIGLIYVSLGTTNYTNICTLITNILAESTQDSTIFTLQIAFIFIMVSLLFKLGAAPFHNWVPDVYQGSASIVSLYFVTVPKLALISALIILINNGITIVSDSWIQVLIICSILSMIIGTSGALNQYNLKRLLAYSAISHTGYLLIGVLTSQLEAVVNITVYLIIYIFMSLITWGILINTYSDTMSSNVSSQYSKLDVSNIDTLESSVIIDNNEYHKTSQFEIKGLGRTHPILALILAITLLSLAGIPPLSGFYTKWLVFSVAVQHGFIIVATIGIVTSVIGAVYYLRVIHFMYFRLPENKFNQLTDTISGIQSMKLNTSLLISFGVLVVLVFLFIPQVLIDIVTIAVLSLF